MRSIRSKLILVIAVLTLGALPVLAAEPNYRYVEGGYLSVDVDDLDGSGDNYFLGGSFGGSWWHIPVYYAKGDLGPDFEQTTWRVGFGWHGLLGDKADVIGEADYVDQSIDGPGPDDSDTGYRLVGGVRWVPFALLELDGFANYNDVGSESDISWEARGIINIWRLGFGADYEKFDDSDQWNAFIRFNFGER
jgi:hypothetical protein